MILEGALLQYGMSGIFILYLIYDKQVLMKRVITSFDKLTEVIRCKVL